MCYNYDNFIEDGESGHLYSRYKLRASERRDIERRNIEWREFRERLNFYYTNGFDHHECPVITMEKPDEIQFYSWGLVPHWVKDKETADKIRKGTLNARSETIFSLPSYRSYVKTQRCLILATGLYEWRHVAGKKYPYHISLIDESAPGKKREFCFGGLYSSWVNTDGGEVFNTFTIITTPPNELMAIIHNTGLRMPLILSRPDEERWLSPELNIEQIKELMKPYPSSLMEAHTISRLITTKKVNRNVPEIQNVEEYAGVETRLKG